MIGSIDGSAVAAQIRMERQVNRKKSFLLVEGSDDIAVLRKFIDKTSCELVNGFKKQNVIDAVCELEEGGILGVCGIVDADFDRLLGIEYETEHILVTDCHDLDVLIFLSPALEDYLAVVADTKAVTGVYASQNDGVRGLVFAAARVLGACRLTALNKGFNIYFRDLEISKFVDDSRMVVDPTIFEHLVERSHNPKCNARQLKALADEVLIQNHADRDLCQGHDTAEILGIALRKRIAARKPQQTWGAEIEKHLRLAFDREAFSKTALCRDLRKWEASNRPWCLLQAGLCTGS